MTAPHRRSASPVSPRRRNLVRQVRREPRVTSSSGKHATAQFELCPWVGLIFFLFLKMVYSV
jgi:hypothetical protein